jgi:Mycoplasma protein of unknown function, DUF285
MSIGMSHCASFGEERGLTFGFFFPRFDQTRKVTTMKEMFSGAESFGATGSNLTGWDLSNVEDTSAMFQNATSFNADISTWNSK